jgi:heptosyltransferase III
MHYEPQHRVSLQQKMPDHDWQRPYVVIQPTARQYFKLWDDEKFSQVCDALIAKGYDVFLTSGPAAAELAIVNRIAEQCAQPPLLQLAGVLSFVELAALIDGATLFIGLDSAPMHIAAALNTPLVSLFGTTSHQHWRPWSDNYRLVLARSYQPMPDRQHIDRKSKYLCCMPSMNCYPFA